MNNKRVAAINLIVICLFLNACNSGQLFGPTITPTPTKTQIPSLTPEPTHTSTPTITPVPTLPNIAPPAPNLTLSFFDDFSDPKSGWKEENISSGVMLDARKNYSDGHFEIVVLKKGLFTWAKRGLELEDFTFEVEVNYLESPELDLGSEYPYEQVMNIFGLVFRVQDVNNFYMFGINGLQQYFAGKYESGVWTSFDIGRIFKDIGSSKDINIGEAVNKLKVTADGNRFSFFVNDHHLIDVTDDTFTNGDIGLMGSASPVPGKFIFDNAALWLELPGAVSEAEKEKVRLVEKEEVEDMFAEQEIPFLAWMAEEQYTAEQLNQMDATLTYTINLSESQPLAWGTGWCAATEEILAQNMENIQYGFVLNGVEISPDQFLVYDYYSERQQGYCRQYLTVLTDWQSGEHTILTMITYDQPINDGWEDYPSGTKKTRYTVNVNR